MTISIISSTVASSFLSCSLGSWTYGLGWEADRGERAEAEAESGVLLLGRREIAAGGERAADGDGGCWFEEGVRWGVPAGGGAGAFGA